ncbi:hypothetical protein DUNSADRAFT_245 [Dunaliella salina]|uniref:Uncharacterized protein n=1 Tax=Dunaliella salina TaxID=3046 RepID=A0ABQ7FZA7_DUNSA|nr:hypothetical protein DUNSADRAFT_245 [Dunaliella salina]|eukprot:KAF5827689.1 hypothetical protein DUNSADRAFT_245 [Dunaliella salina]
MAGQLDQSKQVIISHSQFCADLLRQRLRMLHQMHVLAISLGDLLMAGQLALSVSSCSVLRDRMAREEDSLFPEHNKRFAFDDKGQVYVVVSEEDERPGLPLWVSSLVHTQTETAARVELGMEQALGQKDVLQLITTATAWKDAQGNEVPKRNGLPDPPNGSRGSDILLQVSFASVLEARARACLLLALTYDPRLSQGAMLKPLHATHIAQRLELPSSRASTPFGTGGSLTMHRWSSVHSQLASRLQSPGLDAEWVHSQIGSLPASRGSTMRPLTGTSPQGSPQRPSTRETHSREGAMSQGSLRESAASRQSPSRHSSPAPRLSATQLTDLARNELLQRERPSPFQRDPRAHSPMRTAPAPGSYAKLHGSSSFSMRVSFSRLPPLYQQRPASEQGPPGHRPPARSTYPLHLASEAHPLELALATQEQPLSVDALKASLEEQQQLLLVRDPAAQQQGRLEQQEQEQQLKHQQQQQQQGTQPQPMAQQDQEDLQRMDFELEQKQRQQWARLQELRQQQRSTRHQRQQQQQLMDGKRGQVQEGPPKSPSAMSRSRSPGGLGTSPLESDAEAEEIQLRLEMDARFLMLSDTAKARLERDHLVHGHEYSPMPSSPDGTATPDSRPTQNLLTLPSLLMLPAFLQASKYPRTRPTGATRGPYASPQDPEPQQVGLQTQRPHTEAVPWESLPGVFLRKRMGLPGSKSAAALLQELQYKAEMLQGMQASKFKDPMGLTIEKATIGSMDATELLEAVKLTQAALMREEGLRMQQEANREREAAKEEEVRRGREKAATQLLWVKHTNTSHDLAPGYMPLSSMTMARLVAEMRAVYRAAAMEQVAAARKDHTEREEGPRTGVHALR